MSSFDVVVAILVNDVKQLFGKKITFCDVMVNNGDNKLKVNLFLKQILEPCEAMVARV
jgi:hypothetical protein